MAQLQKREKIMAASAGALVVIFLASQFLFNQPEAPQKLLPQAPQQQLAGSDQARVQAAPRQQNQQMGPKPGMTPEPTLQIAWGRDPFAQTYRLETADTTGKAVSDFALRGILWQGRDASVLIGDEILRRGERSGDLTVLDIQRDRAVCKKGGEIITLVLNENDK